MRPFDALHWLVLFVQPVRAASCNSAWLHIYPGGIHILLEHLLSWNGGSTVWTPG